MRKSNVYSKIQYAILSLLWLSIFTLFFVTLFSNSLTLNVSNVSILVFFFIFTISGLLWYFLTFDSFRNKLGIALYAVIPYGTLVYISYVHYWKLYAVIPIVVGIMALAWLVYSIKKYPSLSKKHTRQKIKYCSLCMYIFTGLCCCIIMLASLVQSEIGIPSHTAKNSTSLSDYHSEKYTLRANIDEVCKLEKGTWKTMSEEEKLKVLQTVVHIEFNYLGLPDSITLETSSLTNHLSARSLAAYSDRRYQILINEQYINSASSDDLLHAICHESYHAYEHRLVGLYNNSTKKERQLLCLYKAREYELEINNYITADKDLDNYFKQSIEVDANTYADYAVEEYFRIIKKHLNQ